MRASVIVSRMDVTRHGHERARCTYIQVVHCAGVLAEMGYGQDDVDTFSILLYRIAHDEIHAEQFYRAVLPVILLSADADEAEDTREAIALYEILRNQQLRIECDGDRGCTVKGPSCESFLLSLGYSDDEVFAVMSQLELDEIHCESRAFDGDHGDSLVHHELSVSMPAFVDAVSAMLRSARHTRITELARRKVATETALYEPCHPLLCLARSKAGIQLQQAWRCKLARARFNTNSCRVPYLLLPDLGLSLIFKPVCVCL